MGKTLLLLWNDHYPYPNALARRRSYTPATYSKRSLFIMCAHIDSICIIAQSSNEQDELKLKEYQTQNVIRNECSSFSAVEFSSVFLLGINAIIT